MVILINRRYDRLIKAELICKFVSLNSNQNNDRYSMMNLKKEKSVRLLGEVSIDNLLKKVSALSVNDWEKQNAIKPNKFDVLDSTQHIVFRFINDFKNHKSYSDRNLWSEWKESIEPILESVADFYGYHKAEFPRIMLAKLPIGGEIKPHIDKSPAAQFPHKIHVPLQTNEKAFFHLEETSVNMKVGNAYEVNNNVLHWVKNNGKTDRIHLIFECFEAEN